MLYRTDMLTKSIAMMCIRPSSVLNHFKMSLKMLISLANADEICRRTMRRARRKNEHLEDDRRPTAKVQ
jgi:hypothetical protein